MKNLYKEAVEFNKKCYKGDLTLPGFIHMVYMHPESPAFDSSKHLIVIPFSAGVDSWVAYSYALSKGYSNVKLVYIDYGHSYSNLELETAKRILVGMPHQLEIIKLNNYIPTQEEQEKWGEIFPGRNWIMPTKLAEDISNMKNINSAEIWINAISGEVKEIWGDKSKLFFSEGTKILSDNYEKMILLRSPVAHLTKGQLIHWYLKKFKSDDVMFQKLLQTVSCHNISDPTEEPCGECMGCTHRWHGMITNGINEKYKVDPNIFANKIYKYYVDYPQFSDMTADRLQEIKFALKGEKLYE